MSDQGLILSARYPTAGHLYEALLATLRMALGSLLIVLSTILLRPGLAHLRGRLFIAALASALPARRASKLTVRDTLAYE